MSEFTNTARTTRGRWIAIVVAIAVAVIAFPVGVWAAGTTVITIADPAHPTRKAHVSSNGRLLTTVDGTVASRPVAPAKSWRFAVAGAGASDVVLGPTTSAVDVSSLTVTAQADGADFTMTALHVPASATDCSAIDVAEQFYYAFDLKVGTPLAVSFPTPLRVTPTANHKICIVVVSPGSVISVNGYLG